VIKIGSDLRQVNGFLPRFIPKLYTIIDKNRLLEKQDEKDRMIAFKEALDTNRRLEAERWQREIEANNMGGSLNPIKLGSSNPGHGEVYLIQYYVIKIGSDLRQVNGFLPRFIPKLYTIINKNRLFINLMLTD
jgi:hypothetical protein